MLYNNYPQPGFTGFPPYPGQNMVQPQQPQPGEFICVPNTDAVETYPIAPGSSLRFCVEGNPPIIATKTKGQNPFDQPISKYYDLHERPAPHPQQQAAAAPQPEYATKADLQVILNQIAALAAKLTEQKKEATPNE